MSSSRAFALAANLGLATTLLTFALIVVGSVVRTTGSGLACPDWPLCQGRLIPPFQFNVMIEWTHRLLALMVSVALVSLAAWSLASRTLRPRLGALAALAVVLLAVQILLGALTVWKLLDPSVVSGHLAVALLLFGTLTAFTMSAGAAAEGDDPVPRALRPAGILPLAIAVTAMTYAQALLGGVVSTHHAGLACPDWPTCGGEWFPPIQGLVGLQVLHRYGAYLVTAAMLVFAAATRGTPDAGIRAGGRLALTLTVAQVLLGVCSVFLRTPAWLSAAHLATAVALIAVLLATTFRIATLPARARATAVAPPALGGASPS